MTSAHDWINNPLDIVDGLFGERQTGTSLTAIVWLTRERYQLAVRLSAMLTAMLITC